MTSRTIPGNGVCRRPETIFFAPVRLAYSTVRHRRHIAPIARPPGPDHPHMDGVLRGGYAAFERRIGRKRGDDRQPRGGRGARGATPLVAAGMWLLRAACDDRSTNLAAHQPQVRRRQQRGDRLASGKPAVLRLWPGSLRQAGLTEAGAGRSSRSSSGHQWKR